MLKVEGIRRARGAVLVAGVVVVSALSSCGQEDFTREPPRPPVPVQITGVITPQEVTVSPDNIGGGPIVLVISNQDDVSHTVIFEGGQTREQVGPINPDDAATITTDVSQGTYSVQAGSEQAVAPGEQIAPGRLIVGQRRPAGEDDLLRP